FFLTSRCVQRWSFLCVCAWRWVAREHVRLSAGCLRIFLRRTRLVLSRLFGMTILACISEEGPRGKTKWNKKVHGGRVVRPPRGLWGQ
ncbi:hypothetical protein M441DRAFT_413467, partial [Trichoderma asperellum CBS 433.97]